MRFTSTVVVAVSSIAVGVLGCGGGQPSVQAQPAPPPATGETAQPAPPTAPPAGKPVKQETLAAVGLDAEAIDRTADPCDDFYQFACGGWMARTEIPADKPLAMRSFVAIEDRNLEYEHALLEQLRANPGKDPAAQQLGTFYGSCMNEAAIEKVGLSALKPALAIIDKVKDPRSLSTALGQLQALGASPLFGLGPVQDSADARNVIANLDQGGIGLPDRDYYLSDDAANQALRAAYQSYVETLLGLLGHKAAKQEAVAILALETEIAKVSKDKVARRDPRGTYNKIDRAGVAAAAPRLDWNGFWAAAGLKDVRDVTVTSTEFFTGINALVTSTKPEVWRAYLAFHLTNAVGALLTIPVEEAQFKLEQALTGQPELQPRWKRCVQRTEAALGDLIGQAFVRDRFGGGSKAAAEAQVHAIVAAMIDNLDALPWMDRDTKIKARAKLDAMTYQIGYPKKWKTYAFKLDAKTWTANALAARKAERARQLAKIGKPVDKDDWLMTAAEVNAYYDPQLNGMVFPAGILQPPFYSIEASVPVNLGGMGVVVGHELTHGFDDQGAQYDAVGNLANWWQPATEEQFKQRTRCVIDQYSSYEVAGNTKLNGANTVGENIADIGGVKLSLAASRKLRSEADSAVVAEGFTEDQQFFLGFGQAWCSKLRPDFEKLLATVDVHSPAKWRVNGSLSATPEFAAAFRCKAGAKMAPVKQCVVW